MRLYAYLNLFDCLISLSIAILIGFKGQNRRIVGPFVGWTFCIALWSFGVGMHALADVAHDQTGALFWSRFLHYGAVPLPAFFLHFVINFCQLRQRLLIFTVYLLSFAFAVLIPTSAFVHTVSSINGFYAFPKAGSIYPAYVLLFVFCVNYSAFALYRRMIATNGIERNQALYMLTASCIAHLFGSTAFLQMFDVPVFPFGTPFVTLYAILIAYTILRFRLMDFGLLMRWGVAYAATFAVLGLCALAVVSSIEHLVQDRLGVGKGISTVLCACLSVFFFDALRKKVVALVDKFIFKSPDFEALLSGIEAQLKNSTTLPAISQLIATRLRSIWGADHIGLAIWDPKETRFVFFPQSAFSDKPVARLADHIGTTDFLVRTLETERRLFKYGIVSESELTDLGNKASPGERTTFWKMRRTMRWLGAAVCVPVMTNHRLLAFLILGSKKSSSRFNDEDKKFLAHVSEIVAPPISILSAAAHTTG